MDLAKTSPSPSLNQSFEWNNNTSLRFQLNIQPTTYQLFIREPF
jgi:hypothetical protein